VIEPGAFSLGDWLKRFLSLQGCPSRTMYDSHY
jgi:hypothetical protein